MVSAASGKNISLHFGSVTTVKKKVDIKIILLHVKTLFPLEIFSQNIGMRSVHVLV